jgi:hypothetical protein
MTGSRIEDEVAEALGHYVYALRDATDGSIFYVGRGQSDRLLHHEWEALRSDWPSDKLERIRRLGPDGVQAWIIRHGLSQAAAAEVEAALIDALNLHEARRGHVLTNAVRGADTVRGLQSLDDVRARYEAQPLNVSELTVFVKIEQMWREGLAGEDLWEASRKWWRLSPETGKARPRLLIAVARGLVRGAWRIAGGRHAVPSASDPDYAIRVQRLGPYETNPKYQRPLCIFDRDPDASAPAGLVGRHVRHLLEARNPQQNAGYFRPGAGSTELVQRSR